jgi:oxygen-independent coproporphyrinogen-3 oxidase
MIGVYIHIPFCRTRCPYCDFVSRPISGAVPEPFTDALCAEIGAFSGANDVETVFLGGGTPSLLHPNAVKRILSAVQTRFRLREPEITLEANPDDVTPALADAWRVRGINRVSLGVQSFDDATLRYLGRRHDASTARRACACVAERFENWGLDLIFGAYPVDAWDATLKTCVGFAPKHVSAYGLTYESKAPFGSRAKEAVDDATWLRLYQQAEDVLAASGYEHYEISNYARQGFACRHNLIYWRNEEYAGFGPGAYSFIDGVRAQNPSDFETYLQRPGDKVEALRLSPREIRVETVIQRLRLKSGLDKADYRLRFGNDVRADFGQAMDLLIARGLLEEDATAIRPTLQGFVWHNEMGLALVED